jgi:hypothetical protein
MGSRAYPGKLNISPESARLPIPDHSAQAKSGNIRLFNVKLTLESCV